MDNKISNVIGVPVPQWLINQFNVRAEKTSLHGRDTENIKFLANKSAWVRLVSSVNVSKEDLEWFKKSIVSDNSSLTDETSLAKNFVLFAGTSKYENSGQNFGYKQRSGLNGAYGMLGEQEINRYGYMPMPGITSVTIETMGRMGSVRSATINFKVFNKLQLDIVDALYFKLGYTMFLEWANTYYYPSERLEEIYNSTELQSTEDLTIDPFLPNLTKEKINYKIASNVKKSYGNYDAMLGMTTNFNFTRGEDGSYDCTIKLIGLGALAESIKINQPLGLPEILKNELAVITNRINAVNQAKATEEFYKVNGTTIAANEKAKENAQNEIEKRKKEITEAQPINTYFATVYAGAQTDPKLIKEYSINPGIHGMPEGKYRYDVDDPTSVALQVTGDVIMKDISRYEGQYFLIVRRFGLVIAPSEKPSSITINKKAIERYIKSKTQYDSTEIDGIDNIRYPDRSGLGTGAFFSSVGEYYVKVFEQPANEIKNVTYSGPFLLRVKIKKDTVSVNYVKEAFDVVYREILYSEVFGESRELTFKNIDIRIENNAYKILASTTRDKNTFILTLGKDTLFINRDNIQTRINYELSITGDSSVISAFEKEQPQSLIVKEYTKYIKQTEITQIQQEVQSVEAAQPKIQELKPPTVKQIQDEEVGKYQSSLEIILRTIQIYSLNQGNNLDTTSVRKVEYSKKLIDSIFSSPGLYSSFYNDLLTGSIADIQNYGRVENIDNLPDSSIIPFYAKYGFNTSILSNTAESTLNTGNTALNSDWVVNHKKLLTSYVIPYEVSQNLSEGLILNRPVYIPFGTVLMILNHCCLIYDTKDRSMSNKTLSAPLVYIDYNPETNFCLSTPNHLSTDPFKFLIKYNGTLQDYKQLFDNAILNGNAIPSKQEGIEESILFDPIKDNFISSDLPEFRNLDNKNVASYQGKIMNILVDIEYLLNTIKRFSSNDSTNSVYLKSFLENILSDMGKSLGNYNIFRLSYNDAGNCFQIIDDQLTPGDSKEEALQRSQTQTNRTEIPLYGKNSVAKSMEIRTDISTRLANMLAISANSQQSQGALSTDASSFGFINRNFVDRYIPKREESNGSGNVSNKTLTAGDFAIAARFNESIKSFFGTGDVPGDAVSVATNYYMSKLAVVKNETSASRASVLIPVSVNFTTDGISGLSMYQSFTINDELLPYTYTTAKKENGIPEINKVGFCIVGLSHTIQNNQWNTAVKANMVYLKDKTDYNTNRDLNNKFNKKESDESVANIVAPQSGTYSANYDTSQTTTYSANNQQAKLAAENYIGRKLTDIEWNELVSATFAESSRNQREEAYVMGVILNRSRIRKLTISQVLRQKRQFQAVTGTAYDPGPSRNFINGPGKSAENSIYGAAVNILKEVPKNYVNFTSNNIRAYGPGTRPQYIRELQARGGIVIGQTIFSS